VQQDPFDRLTPHQFCATIASYNPKKVIMKNYASLPLVAGLVFALSASTLHAQEPFITCPGDATAECGASSTVTVVVGDTNGVDVTVVWSLNGLAVQTNQVPGTTSPAGTSVSFSDVLPLGTNDIDVSVTDLGTNTVSCSTTVTVVDTTPPVIESVSADPSVLWPPNHKMTTIHVQAVVTDDCGPTTWKIISVTSNEAVNAHGSGHTSPDWLITGDHTVKVRAERAGPGHGRVYTITIQATDLSGNTSQASVTVTVPHDQGHQPANHPNPPSHNVHHHP
jgi:hypothetical protein